MARCALTPNATRYASAYHLAQLEDILAATKQTSTTYCRRNDRGVSAPMTCSWALQTERGVLPVGRMFLLPVAGKRSVSPVASQLKWQSWLFFRRLSRND